MESVRNKQLWCLFCSQVSFDILGNNSIYRNLYSTLSLTLTRLMTLFNGQFHKVSLAFISLTRFFMAYKATKTRTYNKKKVKQAIVAGYVFWLSGMSAIFFTLAWNGHLYAINKCSNEDQKDEKDPKVAKTVGFFAIVTTACIVATLIGDVSLYILMKKRKQSVAPTEKGLIPWVSSSKELYNMEVPIYATSLSAGLLVRNRCLSFY